ncbi:glycosyltransferase involved in cell wall biosynthesis [Novosphingobium sp. 1529]|uniref:glycosyltransferase n=1 Tax=Novosphingobium sp. 1529 TaxID=3156424 RepID=UPI00339560FC
MRKIITLSKLLDKQKRRADIARDSAEIAEVDASGLFDAQWYVDRYPDVAAAGVDPLRHFMQFGWREKRAPNPLFDVAWYLDAHPDLATWKRNPLLHYIRHGGDEARDTGPAYRPNASTHPISAHGVRYLQSALRYRRMIAEMNAAVGAGTVALRPHVLIIAELSIAQCRKYRVDQKSELLKQLGYAVTVIDWRDEQQCEAAIASPTLAIFYRVPAYPGPLRMIERFQAQGVPTLWEVDDLIFDPNSYIENSGLQAVSPQIQRDVLSGVPAYRAAMLACDGAIASTSALAAAMREAGVERVFIVENALDSDTLDAAQIARTAAPPPGKDIRIVYGSGTNTHDADFRVAAPALLDILKSCPQVRLRIIGELGLPEAFDAYADRVERFGKTNYADYLTLMAVCDIAIAPLEATVFNEAKSNIKFIEAAVCGLPAVCSPRAPFVDAIDPGKTGFLAADDREWRAALRRLVESRELRKRVGAAAEAAVHALYDPAHIAATQLSQVLPPVPRKPLRVLSANVFFEPRSFGGATIVAEQMAHRLHARDDTEVVVFTTAPFGATATPYELVRYHIGTMPVFAITVPDTADAQLDFETDHTLPAFRAVLREAAPDVVHLHSIQTLGAGLIEACKAEGIPVVVTLHDAWWICGRQFMVRGDDTYCHQTKIDLNVCGTCVKDDGFNIFRQYRLRQALLQADLLLTPSAFFRDIYAANGFDPARLKVNRNGVARPTDFQKLPSPQLRFGFVGGNSRIKGAHLIKQVFADLDRSDYELALVDNLLSLGFASLHAEDWPIGGTLTLLPAYDQDTMDTFWERVDVLLFPTQWKESFGLTVREALMRDVWVIATDAGGVVEDIVDGENGDIIPLDDDGTMLRAAVERALARHAKGAVPHNAHKHRITDHTRQAEELHGLLQAVVKDARAAAKIADGPIPLATKVSSS